MLAQSTTAISELHQQANAYQIHQDTLRWNLFAGYVAFFAGVVSFREHIHELPVLCGIGIVILADLYLLLLAVESWHYNAFVRYVDFCERLLVARAGADQPLTAAEFTASHRLSITPNHPSYSLAMLVVALGNSGLVELLCPAHRYLHFVAQAFSFSFGFYGSALFIPSFECFSCVDRNA